FYGPLQLVTAEGGFMNQKIGCGGGLDDGEVRASVSGVDQAAAIARRTHQICREEGAPIFKRDRFSLVQTTPEGAFGNPQRPGALRIEPAQPRMFHQSVADGIGAMLG